MIIINFINNFGKIIYKYIYIDEKYLGKIHAYFKKKNYINHYFFQQIIKKSYKFVLSCFGVITKFHINKIFNENENFPFSDNARHFHQTNIMKLSTLAK